MASSLTCPTGRLTLNADTLFKTFKTAQILVVKAGDINGTFPSFIDTMPLLRRLHFSPSDEGSTLSIEGKLPVSFRNLTVLESLELHSTQIKGFEELLGTRLPNLREFDVKDSLMFVAALSRLHDAFPNLVRLDGYRTLISGHLVITTLLSRLETVVLAGSTVEGSMFSEIEGSKSLKYIDLSNTLADGPLSLKGFPALEVLLLSGSRVRGPLTSFISTPRNLTRLDLSYLDIGGTIPESLYELQNLRALDLELSNLQNASISAAIGNLSNLQFLSLADCNLIGTIPNSVSQLKSLISISLKGNNLEGSIPEGLRSKYVDLSSNRLEGLVPESLIKYSVNLDLHQNSLGPNISSTLLSANHPGADRFDFSHNSFAGALPIVFNEQPTNLHELDLSHNNFSGEISPHAFANVVKLDLSYNSLSSIGSVFDDAKSTEYLSLAHNNLAGSLPSLLYARSFKIIDLSFNEINSEIPPLSPNLVEFYASNNKFGGGKTPLRFMASVITSPNLKVLDISHSLAQLGPHFESLLYSNLTHLSLASIGQDGELGFRSPLVASEWLNALIRLSFFPTNISFSPHDEIFYRSPLVLLDLSSNHIEGTFPLDRTFPALETLNVADNALTKEFLTQIMPNIAQLNLSNNQFEFDVADFADRSSLFSLDVSYNNLFGVISLNEVPLLQVANFAFNEFRKVPDLVSFESHFRQYALRTLNIANNPQIPRFEDIDFASVGLNLTASESPSTSVYGAICRTLAFDLAHPDRTFYYDEDLFNYKQCKCSGGHFGVPAESCLKCPEFGANECDGLYLTSQPNTFLFPILTLVPLNQSDSLLNINDSVRIEGESCVFNLMQQFSGLTSCSGTRLSAPLLFKPNVSVDVLLDHQCAIGSGGHLCSQCYCNSTKCYYFGGAFCKECAFVFSTAQATIGLVIGSIVIFIAMTILFYFILRSKRFFSAEPWKNLSFMKRALYRVLLLSSLGNLTILITFVQMLAEVTNWEKYALSVVLRVLNGATEGVGLECALPFLREPFTGFIIRLMLPIIAIIYVSSSIFVAEVLHSPKKYLPCLRCLREGSDAEKLPILSSNPAARVVRYPAIALMSSVGLSVLRFFYFGTAISASDYLFSRSQPYTGILYSRNYPWMLFSDAMPFINASIPTLLIFALLLPLAFIYLCYRMRHSYNLDGINIYFGSLFTNYTARFFWWEIVNILRKLAIAFSIRGFNSTSALQPLSVGLILGVTQFLVLSLHPWRRNLENTADALSQILLLFSLFSSRSSALLQANISNNLIISLDAAFTLASVIYILYLTFTEPTTYHLRLQAELPKSHLMSTNTVDLEADWNLISSTPPPSDSEAKMDPQVPLDDEMFIDADGSDSLPPSHVP